jgi:cysteine desulfurase
VTRHYLDHASTSPLRPAARDAMVAALDDPADPGRLHEEGLRARHLLEAAREQVAGLLGARSREVVLTSGATEAIATAVAGAAARARDAGAVPHQVLPAVEHSAVREAAARAGQVTEVAVDGTGRVDPDALLAAIRPDTALVHVQWGNHEVGTTQPVAEVVDGCRRRGVLVHVDAAQAAGRAPIDFRALGADLMSVSAHKLGGPPGIGALLVRRGLRLDPLLVGGDQERARRAGLENVPAAAGFGAAAAQLAEPGRLDAEIAAQAALADRARAGAAALPGVRLLGHPTHRLPHLVCLGLDGVEPQPVLLGLDRAGVAVHSGSSCSSEALEPSPVLAAMGVDADRSLRLSVGWSSSPDDVDAALDALGRVLADLRRLARGQSTGTA